MNWFDIIKDAKTDGEAFYVQFKKRLIGQLKLTLKDLEVEEVRLNLIYQNHKKLVSNMSPMERQIAQPIIDRHEEDHKTSVNELAGYKHRVELQIKYFTDSFRGLDKHPIETRLVHMREMLGEDELIDTDVLDEIIHRLGFEGRGME
jgi:hypothetical protein